MARPPAHGRIGCDPPGAGAHQRGYVAQGRVPRPLAANPRGARPAPQWLSTLYAVARLDGVGFDIAPTGDQERFVPDGEEVAWRWTLSPRKPGQQRLSVQLRLRWVPAAGAARRTRESQAYARGLDVQVCSFLGMSPSQAAFDRAGGPAVGRRAAAGRRGISWSDAVTGLPPASMRAIHANAEPEPWPWPSRPRRDGADAARKAACCAGCFAVMHGW